MGTTPSGQISLGDVRTAMGMSGQVDMNSSEFRKMASTNGPLVLGNLSQYGMDRFRGKSYVDVINGSNQKTIRLSTFLGGLGYIAGSTYVRFTNNAWIGSNTKNAYALVVDLTLSDLVEIVNTSLIAGLGGAGGNGGPLGYNGLNGGDAIWTQTPLIITNYGYIFGGGGGGGGGAGGGIFNSGGGGGGGGAGFDGGTGGYNPSTGDGRANDGVWYAGGLTANYYTPGGNGGDPGLPGGNSTYPGGAAGFALRLITTNLPTSSIIFATVGDFRFNWGY